MAKKSNEVTVKVSDKVANEDGGFFRKGTKFEPGEGCDVEELKKRGLVE